MAQAAPDLLPDDLEPQPAPSRFTLFQAAWRRKGLLALGMAAGLLAGAVYYSQRPIVYQSSAQVMVIKNRADSVPIQSLNGGQSLAYDDYASSHAALLHSPLIVERAVKEHDLQQLPSLAGQGDPAGLINSNLSVGVAQNGSANPILNLSYRGAAPEDCRAVLNAVIHSYEKFLSETYQNVNKQSAELINKATELLQTDLKNLKKKQQELRATGPVLVRDKEGTLPQQERLANIDARRSTLMMSQAEIKGRIAKIRDAVAQKKDPTPWLEEPVDSTRPPAVKSEGLAGIESQLITLQLQEQDLAETVGPEHPDLRAVRKRLENLRDLKAHFKDEGTSRAGAGPKTPASPAAVREVLGDLQARLENGQEELTSLDGLYQEELKDVKTLSVYADQEDDLRKSIADTQQMYDSLMKPLQQIDLVKDYNGYNAQTIAPPGAGTRVEPNALSVFPLAGFAGLAFGLALALLAEASDKSFRSAHEVRRRLGLAILGHVPRFNTGGPRAAEAAELDPSLCAVHRTKSLEAEAFRGVRTALYFSTQGKGHKVVQITSPSMGDGKTILAANLAVSIAQSGKRVLLIDADCRRPRQHRLFNIHSQRGLATVVSGEAEPDDVVQASVVPNLWVLPCGPRPNNPAEVLTSPRFAELLAMFRERYDFVIVDTPPLLAVSDPMAVAPRVDAVILTLRLTRNGRPNAERAKDMLTTIGANILGVVVTGQKGYAGQGHEYAYVGGYDQEGADGEVVAVRRLDDSPDQEKGPASADGLGGSPPPSRRTASSRAKKGRSLLGWVGRVWGS